MNDNGLTIRFQAARRDRSLAVLEGFHALKHALRFGATVDEVVTRDLDELTGLAAALAPDLEDVMRESARVVPADVFDRLAAAPPETGVIALARRRIASASELLGGTRAAPAVFLESPSRLGNIGAAIRVAAAAGASAVISTGPHDPWHPAAIRAAAGLQFALPVAHAETFGGCRGPLVALHPDGDPLRPEAIPPDAVLAFGSERRGLSQDLLSRADRSIRIPMQPGVSSVNLANAVAIALYAWRLAQ